MRRRSFSSRSSSTSSRKSVQREEVGIDGGEAEGQMVEANAVKTEQCDGSYACVVYSRSVRGDAHVV